MKYVVLERSNIPSLERAVEQLIVLGWEPQGGVAYTNSGGPYGTFFQAMIKREKI